MRGAPYAVRLHAGGLHDRRAAACARAATCAWTSTSTASLPLDRVYDTRCELHGIPAPTPDELEAILVRSIAPAERLLDGPELDGPELDEDEDEQSLARAYLASTRSERDAADDDPHDFGCPEARPRVGAPARPTRVAQPLPAPAAARARSPTRSTTTTRVRSRRSAPSSHRCPRTRPGAGLVPAEEEARGSARHGERWVISKETRSYAVEHVHQLRHLDFHECSRAVLLPSGALKMAQLLGPLDDHARLSCDVSAQRWRDDRRPARARRRRAVTDRGG